MKQLSGYILKISDMGLSKQLDAGEGSFASMSMSMPSAMPSGAYICVCICMCIYACVYVCECPY